MTDKEWTARRKKEIGAFVREKREELGLGRREFGHLIGYEGNCDTYIHTFETGRTYIPPEKIRLVRQVLDCSYEDLIP